MVKIILVRHGETEWNKVKRIQGSASDTPLNEIGKAQAERVALRLKNEKIQAIYSSPLQRALHTAQAIARYHQLEVNQTPSLKEINVGELEGVFSADMKVRFDEFICRMAIITSNRPVCPVVNLSVMFRKGPGILSRACEKNIRKALW